MYQGNVVLCADVSVDSGKDLGQHWPSVWSAWHGARQLYKGNCHIL